MGRGIGGTARSGRGGGGARALAAAPLLALLLPVLLAGPGCGAAAEFSPSGTVPALPERFSWPEAAEAEEYELRIYRPDQTLLLESPRLKQSSFPIDDALRERLTREGEFEWWIRGYERGRAAGRSETVRVRIAP